MLPAVSRPFRDRAQGRRFVIQSEGRVLQKPWGGYHTGAHARYHTPPAFGGGGGGGLPSYVSLREGSPARERAGRSGTPSGPMLDALLRPFLVIGGISAVAAWTWPCSSSANSSSARRGSGSPGWASVSGSGRAFPRGRFRLRRTARRSSSAKSITRSEPSRARTPND